MKPTATDKLASSPRACRPGALVLLCLIVAAGAPRGARAVTVSPVAEVELREDRLPGRAQQEGWIARVSPQMTLTRAGSLTTFEISGLRSFDSHRGFEGPERAGDAAALRFNATPSPHSALSAQAGYVSSRDPLGSDATPPLTFSESAIATAGARLELWRLESDYRVRARSYASNEGGDGLAQTWEAAAFPFRRPDTQGMLGAYGRDLQIAGAPELNTRALTLGVRRTHFEGLSSELQVGAAATRTGKGGARSHDLAVVAGARADRGTLRLPFDLRFRIMRDVATTGYVEASLPGRRSLLSARWEQTLGAEGGFFQDPTLARYLTFEARDTLAGEYALSLQGSFGQTRSEFQSGPWLRSHRAWASLSRRVTTWLSAGLDYSFVNQEGDSSVPSWVFRRNRVGLRLTVGAQ